MIRYRDGKYNTIGVFMLDGNSYSGDDPFMSSLASALKEIGAGNHGSALLDYLANHENTLIISHVTGEKNDIEYDAYSGKIFWNLDSFNGGYCETFDSYVGHTTYRQPFIGLVHEMAHAQDKWRGTMDNGTWYITNKGKTIYNSEKQAMHIENMVRSEHNLPVRTHYEHMINADYVAIPVAKSRTVWCNVNLYNGYVYPLSGFKIW